MSHLFKSSLIIATFFAIDKVLALIRQTIIARQFGLSSSLDAFNVANNLPDLLFSLISGGALAMALIPALSEYLTKKGKAETWKVFSSVANITFIVTAILAIIMVIFAKQLVSWELGIAPGFTNAQQDLVVNLMRMNLIATLIFSISGLVMSALQVNKQFFFPAVAPAFYNIGQIIGATVFAPTAFSLGFMTIPGLNLGIYGLVWGVLLGATLHLLVQIPALLRLHFRWSWKISLDNPGVRKVATLMGPRLLTMLCIQIIFLARDNLASRLAEGAVSALTYGWFIMQVPETLIGTAIATALLPTIAEHIHAERREDFQKTMSTTIRVILALTLISTVMAWISLRPLADVIFGLGKQASDMLVWTTRAYLLGLTTHAILEVTVRAFYAQQDAKTPLIATFLRLVIFLVVGIGLYEILGPVGIALADSLAVGFEVVFLLFILKKVFIGLLHMKKSVITIIAGSCMSGLVLFALYTFLPFHVLINVTIGLIISGIMYVFIVREELKMLIKL